MILPDAISWSFKSTHNIIDNDQQGDQKRSEKNEGMSDQETTATKNGVFDLSHTLINIDTYTNLYGNLGLWNRIDYVALLSNNHNSDNEAIQHKQQPKQSLPTTLPYQSTLNSSSLTDRYQNHSDIIEKYLLGLQKTTKYTQHPSFNSQSSYFIASRRFALLVYYHAGVLPWRLFDTATQESGNQIQPSTVKATGNQTLASKNTFNSNNPPSNEKKIPQTLSLLDVGTGCGDQLFTLMDLWESIGSDTSIHITGVNYSHIQTHTAQDRFTKRYPHLTSTHFNKSPTSPISSAQFINGSATELITTMGLKQGLYDAITAIDAIYHFSPKLSFLRDAFDLLKSSGWFVCTDLLIKSDLVCDTCQAYITGNVERNGKPSITTILTNCVPQGHLAWLLPHFSEMFSIPSINLWTQEQYKSELEGIGYENVNFLHLDSLIFNHFSSFLDQLAQSFPSKLISPSQWLKFTMTGHALKHWAPHLFRYTLVMAQKKKDL